MPQKKILLLGGLRYLLPVIEAAKELGCYVITCDNVPDNIAHKYSDEYQNVSIVDKDAVLALAQKLQIDGIMSFAVDPGVTTAAYVAEKLGLPSSPYESVKILQNKGLFRKFLADNNFNTPRARTFKNYEEALRDIENFVMPIIVKPVDSAGSKGVTKVSDLSILEDSINYAIKFSFSKEVIIEEFIEQKGCSSDTDCFSIGSELQFISFNNQYFDNSAANPYTPSAYNLPSSMSQDGQKDLAGELKRLVKLLDMGNSIFNVETRESVSGKTYIMEVSPRGGGNRLSELLRYATGIDLIKCAVKAAIGLSIESFSEPEYNGYWLMIVVYSDSAGKFVELQLRDDVKKYSKEVDLWVKPGEEVDAFNAANNTIGTLILHIETKEEFKEFMAKSSKRYNVIVE